MQKKVITYGTYDLLHYGHIKLLERAKSLGDYLIVAVTSDDFDKSRGKINVKQSLMERVAAVKATGLADAIIIEEYEGQKIDDIKRYGINTFTVGSDWEGYFDYLKEYCNVVYLERTKGVSSSELRAKERNLKIGLVGSEEIRILEKYYNEFSSVNGAKAHSICTVSDEVKERFYESGCVITDSYGDLLKTCDAVFILSHPSKHYEQIKQALEANVHVLCESPIALKEKDCIELIELAKKRNLILMDAIKTAYAMAYNRLLLLIKSGRIGEVCSVDATCTSLIDVQEKDEEVWNSICAWGPTAMLPIFHIFGVDYISNNLWSLFGKKNKFDLFTKGDFVFKNGVASFKVGRGVKSEGELIISGTKGYIYVPAPWWKTDYFEIRYENTKDNKRYFYQLEGEGIRYQLVAFLNSVVSGKKNTYVEEQISIAICRVMEKFYG